VLIETTAKVARQPDVVVVRIGVASKDIDGALF
jgi:hypothetical protein